MEKLLSTIKLVAILCIAAIVGLQADASAQGLVGPFNDLSVKGTFPCHEQGTEYVTIPGVFSGELVFDQVTLVTYDGKGHSKGTFEYVARTPFSSTPAFVCNYTSKGTYHVNPNGTGTASSVGTLVSGPCPDTVATSYFLVGGPHVFTSIETIGTPVNYINSASGGGTCP